GAGPFSITDTATGSIGTSPYQVRRAEKRSRAYYYSPSRSREEATSEALRALLDSSTDPSAVLLHFAKTVSDREYDALRRGWTGRAADQ
ncbi:BlaI/MecI/CopY family transcriptional regulator, partial [Rhodococcus rhodochrous]|uniref:BlaI/MecI/CopY family transcriptional regulator n=1 Tax=Rhodococcus rhodochrous TaxID=1829 RepID=UPI003D0B3D2B